MLRISLTKTLLIAPKGLFKNYFLDRKCLKHLLRQPKSRFIFSFFTKMKKYNQAFIGFLVGTLPR